MTDDEIDGIIAKLTKAQREALMHPNAGGCAYSWARRGTCEALVSRGLAFRDARAGSMFSPSTAIKYPLSLLGLAVRSRLSSMEVSNG